MSQVMRNELFLAKVRARYTDAILGGRKILVNCSRRATRMLTVFIMRLKEQREVDKDHIYTEKGGRGEY